MKNVFKPNSYNIYYFKSNNLTEKIIKLDKLQSYSKLLLTKCSKESIDYNNCVSSYGIKINQFECDKEFTILKNCLNSK